MHKRRRGEANPRKTAEGKKEGERLCLSRDILGGCSRWSAGSSQSLSSPHGECRSAEGPPQALWEGDAQQPTFPEQRAEKNTHLSSGD